jgi:hypothetical protein
MLAQGACLGACSMAWMCRRAAVELAECVEHVHTIDNTLARDTPPAGSAGTAVAPAPPPAVLTAPPAAGARPAAATARPKRPQQANEQTGQTAKVLQRHTPLGAAPTKRPRTAAKAQKRKPSSAAAAKRPHTTAAAEAQKRKPSSAAAAARPAKRQRTAAPVSKYVGAAWFARTGRWKSAIKQDKKNLSLGYFDSQAAAARAYDAAARKLRGDQAHGGLSPGNHVYVLNFPTKGDVARAEKLKKQRAEAKRQRCQSRSSRFIGVAWHKRTGNWGASITHDQKSLHLGYFDAKNEEGAARA